MAIKASPIRAPCDAPGYTDGDEIIDRAVASNMSKWSCIPVMRAISGMTTIGTTSCPWCSAPVERRERGGHIKEFCSTAHKDAYKNGIQKLALW